jgi:hypothetical protein
MTALRLAPLSVVLLAAACFDTSASNIEMREAVGEIVAEGQAQALENEVIEITTDFTIGGAAEDIAGKIRELVESQVDCSTVTVAGSSVEIDLGGLDDGCEYNGHTFAGKIRLDVSYAGDGTKVVVDHTYTALTNGKVTLDGTKRVEWDASSRHVVHDYDWTRDDRTVHATGDRVQTLLDPAQGVAGGIEINGARKWESAKGAWDLAIDGVEVRWSDPVPQAGSYTLTTARDRTITMTFTRVDEDTIEVRVTGGRRDRVYHVNRAGQIDDQGEA